MGGDPYTGQQTVHIKVHSPADEGLKTTPITSRQQSEALFMHRLQLSTQACPGNKQKKYNTTDKRSPICKRVAL